MTLVWQIGTRVKHVAQATLRISFLLSQDSRPTQLGAAYPKNSISTSLKVLSNLYNLHKKKKQAKFVNIIVGIVGNPLANPSWEMYTVFVEEREQV